MQKGFFRTLTILIALFAMSLSKTQAQFVPSDYEIGANIGYLVYFGDLSTGRFGDYSPFRPSIGLSASKILSNKFSLRASLVIGSVGDDESKFDRPSFKKLRNFQFTTPITELSGQLVWNLYGENRADAPHRLSPYVFAGLGLTFLNVKRDWHRNTISLAGLGMDTLQAPPTAIPVLPLGVGVRYLLNQKLTFTAEANFRFTATDYLDGFKYSVNPGSDDYYYGISIGLVYRLGNNGYDCPKSFR